MSETLPLIAEEGTGRLAPSSSTTALPRRFGSSMQQRIFLSLSLLALVVVVTITVESSHPDGNSSASFHAKLLHRFSMARSPQKLAAVAQKAPATALLDTAADVAARAQFVATLPDKMRALINNSINPCEDFHAWACGTFEDDTPIPEDKSSFAYSWDGDARTISHELAHLMEDDKEGKAGMYYAACMNADLVEERGLVPVQPWLAMVDTVDSLETLAICVAKLHQAEVGNLFDWFLATDDQDPERELLMIDSGGLDLPDSSYYTDASPRNLQHLSVYRKYLSNLYALYGFSPAEAQTMVEQVLEVETELASHSNDDNEVRHAVRYELEGLEKDYPNFKWRAYFAAMDHSDIASEYKQIGVSSPAWLKVLDGMLVKLPLEKIKAYIRSHLMFNVSPLLGRAFFAINLDMDSDLYGVSAHPKRSEKCVGATKAALPFLVSKMFVDKYFPISAKETATVMMENIRDAFRDDLLTVPWMSKESRAAALEKLEKIFFEVGYPARWPEYHFPVTSTTYFENSLQSSIWRTKNKYERLRHKVERHRWTMAPATVNAYYDNGVNGVFIPAGLLQPPFFDDKMPLAHNYGSAGSILSHELTHGFDNSGRKYDADCRRRQWWDTETIANFRSRANCIAEMYSEFKIAGSHVHGNNTVNENIADIGGLKSAHRAYLKEEAKRTPGGADLFKKKMFWTSFAQTWCGVDRKKVILLNLLTDVHSPDKFRILGPLKENADFAQDFSCPAGSPMNPVKRCDLW